MNNGSLYQYNVHGAKPGIRATAAVSAVPHESATTDVQPMILRCKVACTGT
jgi:hypothetical protein